MIIPKRAKVNIAFCVAQRKQGEYADKVQRVSLRIRVYTPVLRRQRQNGQAVANRFARKLEAYILVDSDRKHNQRASGRVLSGDKTINKSREVQCVYSVYAQHNPERSQRYTA